MSNTPNLKLPELANSAGNQINANTTFAILDALVQPVAVSKTLTSAPGSPANGAVYIMASAWPGVFRVDGGSCVADDLALYRTGSGWLAIQPKEGWKCEVAADDTTYRFDGSDWVSWSTGGGGGVSSVVAGTGIAVDSTDPANPIVSATGSLTNPMTTRGDIITAGTSGVPGRLAKGTTGSMLLAGSTDPVYGNNPLLGGYAEVLDVMSGTSIDVSTSNVKKKVLSANTTFSLTGATSGQCHSFTLMLEGGSSYTVTWPASVKWLGGAPTYTAYDVITGFSVDGGTTWLLTYAGSYA